MNNVEELLRQLMNIPSISGEESQVCQFVFDLLKKKGFETKKYPVSDKRFNIVGKINKNPKVYFQAHLDTVPPHIRLKEDNEFIYGRGACDTKGSAAAMITAGILAKNKGINNFGLIFTVGEEDKLDGAIKLAKEIEIPFVIVGEPSNLDIINEHFGLLIFRVNVKGKAAHSSRPEEGLNAVDILLEYIQKTKSIQIHPNTLLSITKLNGGVADNIIPEIAQATYSFRLSPEDKKNYFELFSSQANGNIKLENIFDVGSVATTVPKELEFIKTRRKVKYFTELSMFKNGVIIGPGDIKHAHGSKDQISKQELSKAVDIYSQIIRNYN